MYRNYEVHKLKTYSFNFANYSYILVDKSTRAALIIDPSWEIHKIRQKLIELDVNLEAIALTHSHYDHTNLVEPLIAQYNANVYMAKAEIDYYGFRCKNLYGLHDLEEIKIGETKLSCILTPGHTVGGMCYLLKDSIFTGDTIFIEGCGICSTKGGSPEDMFESIQKIKATVSPKVRVYPGHSYGEEPGKPIKYLMGANIYFMFNKKKDFVNFRMRENQNGLLEFK